MLKALSETFHDISIWIIVVPFLAGIINYKGLDRDSKWIFLLVLIAIPPQLLTSFLHKNNPWLNINYNLYTPVEFGILYLVFFPKYKTAISRLLVRISAVLFFAFSVVLLFWLGFEKRFLNELVCACIIFYMFWLLLLLRQEYSADETFISKHRPFTWYVIALAVYSPGRVASLALYSYIRDDANPLRISLSLIDSLFNILLYLFFTAGLLIRKPR